MKAEEFDRKFEAGEEDILDDLDLSTARRPGQEAQRVNVEQTEPSSAYDQLLPVLGIVDSGSQQLSTGTGKRLRMLLEERRNTCRPA